MKLRDDDEDDIKDPWILRNDVDGLYLVIKWYEMDVEAVKAFKGKQAQKKKKVLVLRLWFSKMA